MVTIKTRPSLYILKRKDLIRDTEAPFTSSENERESRERSQSRSSSERVVMGESSGTPIKVEKPSKTGEESIVQEKSKDESRLKGDDKTSRVREEDTRQPGRASEDDSDKKQESRSTSPEVDREQTEEKSNEQIKSESKEKSDKDKAEEEKRIEESVRESIKERLKASIKESLQEAKEKRRGKGEKDESAEKIHLPINMDELSKGDFVGTKYEEEVCTNCHGKVSEEMESVGKQKKEALRKEEKNEGKVNSIREDIKKKIIRMKLKEKMESKNRGEEVTRESSDEYINVEDE